MGQTTETNSLEVRWFGTGVPPPVLAEWIAGFGPTDTTMRTDLYLSPPSSGFNVKLRSEAGEHVEIKRRLGTVGRRSFGAAVSGTVEQWYKWSFPLDHQSGLRDADLTGLWLPVKKTRTLYGVDSADLGSLEDGVTAHVEVTEVSALSETAWTCGLEVAGPPDQLEGAFSALRSELFADAFPVSLSAEQSHGYIEWLQRTAEDAPAATGVLVPSNR